MRYQTVDRKAKLTQFRVNTKATLRLNLRDFLPLVPELLHEEIMASKYYSANSMSLVIQGDRSRKQAENAKECYGRLHDLVVEAARKKIRGETSQAQKEKVKAL